MKNAERDALKRLYSVMKADPAPITGTDLMNTLVATTFNFEREKIPAQMDALIEKIEKELETAKVNYGKPFEYADELERLMMKQSEIDSRLEFGKAREVIVDEGDEWEGDEEMVM